MKNIFLKFGLFFFAILVCIPSVFSAEGNVAVAENAVPIALNTVLCIIALVLLFIIIILSMTVNSAIDLFKQKKLKENNTSTTIKALLVVGILLLFNHAYAQDATATAATTTNTAANLYFYAFITIIIVEIAIIFFLIRSLSFLTGIDEYRKSQAKTGRSLWDKLNSFKPIEEEGEADTGHNYDGIRELDNITPPWFTISFIGTIIFAIIYLYRFEIAHTGLSQEQEYEIEVRSAKALQDSLLKLEGNKVDENNVAMLDAAGIESGKKLFVANCGACHGNEGQGGVGPNLTDAYWLHGGSISDVFKSIKYGWADKGMKAWNEDFSPTQIAQLSSFIENLKGTNPPNAKEKQGELYVEKAGDAAAAAPADSTKSN